MFLGSNLAEVAQCTGIILGGHAGAQSAGQTNMRYDIE
jgi:hypothetical protein